MSSTAPESDHPFAVPGVREPSSPRVAPGSQLQGRLPCARCRYELQGLSIAGNCPECGLPIGATILAVVDPFAKELQPIPQPGLVNLGLQVWAMSALLAALSIWAMRMAEVSREMLGTTFWPAWAPYAAVGLTALSGLGAIALVMPHAKIPARQRMAALAACVGYVPLTVLHWVLFVQIDSASLSFDYFSQSPDHKRLVVRLLCGILGVLVTIGLRLNARVLVSRSLVLRTGRVDRQTLYALAAAFGIGVVGDALRLSAAYLLPASMDVLGNAGVALQVLGAVLCTLGLAGVAIDGWRLRRAILSPPLALSELVGRGTGHERNDTRPA
jgi:hypothetical protein